MSHDDPMNGQPLDRLRYICMALPEAVEDREGVGSPAYKVNAKIFAMHHPMNDHSSMWCKAQKGFQEVIVSNEPERFFVPPYVGHHGWIGVWLDVELDWDFIADLIEDSYRLTAPKRLIKLLNDERVEHAPPLQSHPRPLSHSKAAERGEKPPFGRGYTPL